MLAVFIAAGILSGDGVVTPTTITSTPASRQIVITQSDLRTVVVSS